MSTLFDRWWHNFIQWTIIVIPLLFFLWLAGIFTNIECAALGEAANIVGPTGGQVGDELKNIESAIPVCEMLIQLLALGALFAGIIISLSSSAIGAKQIINLSKKAGMKVRDYGKQKGYEAGRRVGARPLEEAGQRLQRVPGLKSIGIALQRPAQRWAEQYKRHEGKLKGLTYEQTKGLLYGRDDTALAAWKKLAQDPKSAEKLKKDFADNPKLRAAFERNLAKSDIRKDDSMKEAADLFPVDTVRARAKRELKQEQTQQAVDEGGGRIIHTGLTEPTDEQIQARIEQKKQEAERSGQPNEYDKAISGMNQQQLASLDARQLASEDVIEAIRKAGKETSGFLQNIAANQDKAQAYSKASQRIMERNMEKIKTTSPETYKEMQNLQRYIAEGQAAAGRGDHEAIEDVQKYEEQLYKLFRSWQDKHAPTSQVEVNLRATPGFAAILRSSKMGRKDIIDMIRTELEQKPQGGQNKKPTEEGK